MSEPHYQGTVHEYDGIIEHDNRLPNWWLMTLFGAVVFAVGYWFYYHTFGVGPNLRGAYESEWSEREKERAAKEAANPISNDVFLSAAKDAALVGRGETLFKTNCAACHGQSAEGLVGPNLTDHFWLHGAEPVDLYRTVAEGVLAKGMPAWKATLGDAQTREVVAYLLTLKGKNTPGPRPAEGVEVPAAVPGAGSAGSTGG
jgi:cytochrome c oxidase cbb3-type subunit 3